MPVCYSCGTPNENSLGLCPACKEKRLVAKSLPQSEESPISGLISNFKSQNLIYLLYGICAVIVIAVIYNRLNPTPAVFSFKDGHYIISDEDQSWVIKYSLQQSGMIKGYILDSEHRTSIAKEGGIFLILHYLDEQSYQEFKKTFANSRQCPAAFYNAHVKHLMLMPDQGTCSKKLANTNFNRWDSFEISGRYISYADGTSPHGKVYMPTNWPYLIAENC